MNERIGILAYGSLIGDPGRELAPHITSRINCTTPFKVEFARSSSSRDGAPTLVPHPEGAEVEGTILLVDLAADEATDRLYRRELNEVGGGAVYKEPPAGRMNSIRILTLENFQGVPTVLYTRIGANIAKLSALELARLAVGSARSRDDGRDGISYLRDALANGIRTPLSAAYEKKLLELLGASDLGEALRLAWDSRPKKSGAPPGQDEIENRLRIAEDYLFAAHILAVQPGVEADVRLLLPCGQLLAHSTEMLLKAMLELEGSFVPLTHDLVDLRHLLAGNGYQPSAELEFVIRFLGPLHAGNVFRYGSGDHGIPTAMQMVSRLRPEIAAFRQRLTTMPRPPS